MSPQRFAPLLMGLVVLAVVSLPAPGGSYDLEWLLGSVMTACQVALSMAVLSRLFRARPSMSLVGELVAGVTASTALQAAWIAVLYTIDPQLLHYSSQPSPTLVEAATWTGFTGIMVYGLWALAFRYPALAQQHAARAFEAERLREAADDAQLASRLAPHFLLNTLNVVAGLVGEDPKRAREVIGALGDLLRAALYGEQRSHALATEIELAQAYARIIEARHGDRVGFAWTLDDLVADAPIPRLLLQPLLENAVQHGALGREGESTVQVRASSRDDRVVITIDNEGSLPDELQERQGLGIVRRRLALLEPPGELALEERDGRTRATVSLRP